ncbi:MAG TPA: type II secretion system F family protein [Terriglobales bacterium]|nr:type II secretion system F family protein [Terriglobales bacterium]
MLVLSTILVFLTAFLAAAAAVVVGWVILLRRSGLTTQLWPADLDDSQGTPRLLKNEELSTISLLAALLARFDFVKSVNAQLAEADLSWSLGRLTAMMLLAGAFGMAVFAKLSFVPSWGVLVAGGTAAYLPYAYVLRRRKVRLGRFEEQFPDALDYLSRALRAGHPFAVSLEMLTGENVAPLSLEMRRTFDERQLGLSWDQALENLARRVPLVDVSFFAAAVQIHTRTGGKLGEVLGRLAETIRERCALRGEIRSIAAHGRLTGKVLTLMPLFVAGVMTLVNPDYLLILLANPYGKDLIMAAVVCLILAHLVIRKIVDIRI